MGRRAAVGFITSSAASPRGRRASFLTSLQGRTTTQRVSGAPLPTPGVSEQPTARAGRPSSGIVIPGAQIGAIIRAGEQAAAEATQMLKKIGETAAREIAKSVENGARSATSKRALPPGEKTEAPPTGEK